MVKLLPFRRIYGVLAAKFKFLLALNGEKLIRILKFGRLCVIINRMDYFQFV